MTCFYSWLGLVVLFLTFGFNHSAALEHDVGHLIIPNSISTNTTNQPITKDPISTNTIKIPNSKVSISNPKEQNTTNFTGYLKRAIALNKKECIWLIATLSISILLSVLFIAFILFYIKKKKNQKRKHDTFRRNVIEHFNQKSK